MTHSSVYPPALSIDDGVQLLDNGTVRIGASARIADIANHALIRDYFPALVQACDAVGTPELRRSSTIGGNLCQRPRCPYFLRSVPCLKNGGTSCPAVDGENESLAILDAGPSYIVHPSDPAVALTALGARLELSLAGARREVPIDEFYVLPSERLDQETILAPDEFIFAVLLSPESRGGMQHYYKLVEGDAQDFALASVAGCKRTNGDVYIVLGGVAPRPWRVNSSVEEDVSTGNLDEDTVATLADRALYDAEPLSKNGYKVDLAASLLRQIIAELGQ